MATKIKEPKKKIGKPVTVKHKNTPSFIGGGKTEAQPQPPKKEYKLVGGEKLFTGVTGQQLVKDESGNPTGKTSNLYTGQQGNNLEKHSPMNTLRNTVIAGGDALLATTGLRPAPVPEKKIADPVLKWIKNNPDANADAFNAIIGLDEIVLEAANKRGVWNNAAWRAHLNIQDRINSKTVGLATGAIGKNWISKGMKSPAIKYILGTAFGTALIINFIAKGYESKGMSNWAQAETPESISFLTPQAINSNNPLIIKEMIDHIEDFENNGMNSSFKDVPFYGTSPSAQEKGVQTKWASSFSKKILQDRYEQLVNGESDEEKYARIAQEKVDAELEATERFNANQRMMREEARLAEIEARNEDARFWRNEERRSQLMAASEREANAKFWLEYKKMTLRLDAQRARGIPKSRSIRSADSRPSKLNFGLL